MSYDDRDQIMHELKIRSSFFASILDDSKPFECRWNDRDFRVHDTLHLRETNERTEAFDADSWYTGREVRVRVRYVLRDFKGLMPGWVVLGIQRMEEWDAHTRSWRPSW